MVRYLRGHGSWAYSHCFQQPNGSPDATNRPHKASRGSVGHIQLNPILVDLDRFGCGPRHLSRTTLRVTPYPTRQPLHAITNCPPFANPLIQSLMSRHQNDEFLPPDDQPTTVFKNPPAVDLPAIKLSLPETKRLRILLPYDQERKSQQIDESRRLFQRLWTDEDEIGLLQGFLEFSINRGGGCSHVDTALFYDQIKSKLQLDFNKNQLVEKLRRLKKKYRTAIGKISSGKEFLFKTAHDQATFEISKKIWSNTLIQDEEDGDERSIPIPLSTQSKKLDVSNGVKIFDQANGVGRSERGNGSNEEAMMSIASQMVKETANRVGVVDLALGAIPVGIGGEISDERWRKQQIMEMEVYGKRLELMQVVLREQVEKLRSIDRRAR